MTDLREIASQSKAWPYEEARRLLKRYPQGKPGGVPLVFECGYGPSGLPHIGTFNEVLRTTMVRNAFATLSDAPTRLIEFSDDMDGLRKVPDNVPNQAMLTEHLGKPLSRIPDPFEKFESFAAHNNAMLREFLDQFGFDYEFISSSSQYESGAFDAALKNVLRNYQGIMDIMLPTLRKERAATYSPILPISEKTGIVLQVPVEVVDAEAGLVRFDDGGDLVALHKLDAAQQAEAAASLYQQQGERPTKWFHQLPRVRDGTANVITALAVPSRPEPAPLSGADAQPLISEAAKAYYCGSAPAGLFRKAPVDAAASFAAAEVVVVIKLGLHHRLVVLALKA